jgi:sialate O-acetylesterase
MYKNKVSFNFLICLIFLLFVCQDTIWANVKLPRIFGSNMVFQQGIENTIWGWGDKGETVIISLNGKTVKTKVGNEGKWTAKLPAMDYGGPYKMTIKGKNLVDFENVMIGEVWICSGQSNMEFPVQGSINSDKEIASANYPNIRLFTVPRKVAQSPLTDLDKGDWTVCSPGTVADFSAVGYFFGREIHQKLNVAIGLINTSWGGTVAETWTSQETIKTDPDLAPRLSELQKVNMAERIESLKRKAKELLGDFSEKDNGIELKYNENEYNDSQWKTIKAPLLWDDQGLAGFDGIAWCRKTIELDKSQFNSNIVLSLGKIDNSDVCWVNGVQVGETSGFNINRRYEIPASVFNNGKNTIAVKVTDLGGPGGIYGSDDDLYLVSENNKVKLAGDWKIKFSELWTSSMAVEPNDYPTLLFNAMISPILPYGIKGAIWYQGESNSSRAKQYQRIFPNLITDWRNQWHLGDFPFFWVQLANFTQPQSQPGESTWAELRESQAMTLKLPNTGMASAIDLGEANDIHPRNKQDVGLRLALNALKVAYSKKVVCSGPMCNSRKIEGSRVIVSFANEGTGLIIKNKYGYINGFSLAGEDREFHWAKAELLNNNSVVVSCDEVKNPVAVRYGWADNPEDLDLYNPEGLPAIPFRTDCWPGLTK